RGEHVNVDYTGENLVFVVGCPRSGTTWVQRLLATHPCVRTGQESDLFDIYVGPQLRAWQLELTEYLLRLLAPMIAELKPGELFVEKTPSHILYLPEIHKLLPAARFVNVL